MASCDRISVEAARVDTSPDHAREKAFGHHRCSSETVRIEAAEAHRYAESGAKTGSVVISLGPWGNHLTRAIT